MEKLHPAWVVHRFCNRLLFRIVFPVLSSSIMVSSCVYEKSTSEFSCIKEMSIKCGSVGGERSIVIDGNHCLDSGSDIKKIMISVPYQDLVNISDISLNNSNRSINDENYNGYEEYLLSLLPGDPIETSSGSGIFYACSQVCRVIYGWHSYAAVSEWREDDRVSVEEILISSDKILNNAGDKCVYS